MSEPFFIVGLPRSKTAWLSLVATGQHSICWHEPTANLSSFGELRALWSDDRYRYVGVSDSSLILQVGRILAEIAPRTLVVERAVPDVTRSIDLYLAKAGYEWNSAPHCMAGAAELGNYRAHPLVRWVEYETLEDVDSVRFSLEWLMPGEIFPKLDEMMHMNVQVDPGWVFDRVKNSHHNGWHLDTSWQRGPEP